MNLSVYFVTPDNPDDALVLAALRGGAKAIQLRDKQSSDLQMLAQAKRLVAMVADFDVPLIINDRLNVAIDSGAAGLHIGQSDGDPLVMRKALGKDKILGLSIERVEQLAQLSELPAGTVDHIGAGPVRATMTKADHAEPMGFYGLAQICDAADIPTVAIGGIGSPDIRAIKYAGCAGMAVVSAISAAADPELATRALVEQWSNT